MNLYDVASGRVVQQWPTLVGTLGCTPENWLPGDNEIQGACFGALMPIYRGANFTVDDGVTTSRDLAIGWDSSHIADGAVAYRSPDHPQDTFVIGGDLTTEEFARDFPAGHEQIVHVPTTLRQGSWVLSGLVPDGFVMGDATRQDKAVLWNPLSGTVITYFDGSATGRILMGWSLWP